MKWLEKVILIAVIIVPIIICVVLIRNIWHEDETNDIKDNNDSNLSLNEDKNTTLSGELEALLNSENEVESGEVIEMAGEKYISKIGSPISKIYSDAVISVALSNAYSEANESSEVVGKFEKYTKVTAHKYQGGWSRVSGNDSTGTSISGWVRTENITYPDDGGEILSGTSDGISGKTGIVTTDSTSLNIREKASSTSNIIGSVAKGTKVTIQEESNNWYKVHISGVTGWISADYVKVNN